MRFTSTTLVLSLLAVSKLVVAVPPACLLAAVATEQNPADLSTLCGSDSLKVQKQIVKLCGGASSEALKAYSSTCSAAGKTVSIISATSTSTSKPSSTGSHVKNSTIVLTSSFFDSSCSCTKTTEISTTTAISSFASASATSDSTSSSGSGSSGSGSASATGSSTAAATGGAALKAKGNSVGSLAAAVIAMAGMAVVL